MRKLTMLIALALTMIIADAQEDYKTNEIQTLFPNQKSLGFYGGFSMGYSQIDGKDALVTGGWMKLK